VALLAERAEEEPGVEITVDLENQVVTLGELSYPFEVDEFSRHCLLEGLDDIGLTHQRADVIGDFETRRPAWLPDVRRGPEAVPVVNG